MGVRKKTIPAKITDFYLNGFKNMGKWGRQVWIIILIKLFVMFVVLRLFFFPNFLNKNFSSDEERSRHVLKELTEIK